MMLNLFRRKPATIIVSLYGAIVAQARQPGFYAELGVPDTLEGRFDMIVLHLALVMRRLRAGGQAEQEGMQELFDLFCRDMDHNLREMGVSDLGVPKKMRKFGEAFYGRAAAYDRALDSADHQAIAEALSRNVFGRPIQELSEQPARLADYVLACDRQLQEQAPADIRTGGVRFPAFDAAATRIEP
jgi:cytochrome b pre-mRNA-processing protein 3